MRIRHAGRVRIDNRSLKGGVLHKGAAIPRPARAGPGRIIPPPAVAPPSLRRDGSSPSTCRGAA